MAGREIPPATVCLAAGSRAAVHPYAQSLVVPEVRNMPHADRDMETTNVDASVR